ncbi:hypothetical protein BDD12DRAFT_803383 [Trichophaea hybrida]|nr:hypothetical protein BDD12DRAFT_803383 [Trichophaea hybrida]
MGITLCLRLWLMLNVRDRQEGNHVTSTRVVTLDDTAPVLSAPKRKPATSNLVFATEVRILDNNFHILNLERLADIELVPTNNLADHLYLDEETGRRRLFIFRCGYFLSAHLAPSRRTAHCLNIFDEEFLLETRQTYKLLFPPIRQDCTKYLRELQEDLKFDEDLGRLPIGSTPPMEPPFVPSDFKFYGKRLAMLSKTLNSSNPTSLSQLWYDRRNKQTWYTMWIAIVVFLLTLFFGFASIIIGGLQS